MSAVEDKRSMVRELFANVTPCHWLSTVGKGNQVSVVIHSSQNDRLGAFKGMVENGYYRESVSEN